MPQQSPHRGPLTALLYRSYDTVQPAPFDRAADFLDALDRAPLGNAPSDSLEGVLNRLARDRRKSPETHRRILARQLHPPDHGAHVYAALPIDKSELNEGYRPAWEMLLLLPPAGAMHAYPHATQALAAIGAPESLMVGERAFEVHVRPELTLDTWLRDRERALFKLFFLTPGKQSLDALCRCLPPAIEQRRRSRYLDPWEPREHVLSSMENLASQKLRQQWLDTIRAGMPRAEANRELYTEMEKRLLKGKSLIP